MPEIFSVSGWSSSGVKAVAYSIDGTVLPGWPKTFNNGNVHTYPVIANLADPTSTVTTGRQIIILTRQNAYPWNTIVNVVKPDGSILNSFTVPDSVSYGTAPALADLDKDGDLEIVIQTSAAVSAYHHNGQLYWSYPLSNKWQGNSSPVIGDIDNDGFQEIAFTTEVAGNAANGYIHILNHDGTAFEKWDSSVVYPIGGGAVPAISDIDNDGHNEVIVSGSYWNGQSGNFNTVWVYDFLIGQGAATNKKVEWGQFMHDENHTGLYGYVVY